MMATAETVGRSLITEEPWDRYRLESLLPLKELYRESTELGFLLRHYWIPATVLTCRQSLLITLPDGQAERTDFEIDRKMARCRSNECLWRERVFLLPSSSLRERRRIKAVSEMLCSYDCHEQTYHADKPILFALPTSEQKAEARRQALYRLPILCPPGPIPIGFTWHAKVGADYMNFCLAAEERLNETSVLVIRRAGRYTRWLSNKSAPCRDDGPAGVSATRAPSKSHAIPVVTMRQGVTLFAWNRGTVLEDRYLDCVLEAGGRLAPSAGTTTQAVTRLMRSCPETLADPAREELEDEEPTFCIGSTR